jgi:hypothetical protein
MTLMGTFQIGSQRSTTPAMLLLHHLPYAQCPPTGLCYKSKVRNPDLQHNQEGREFMTQWSMVNGQWLMKRRFIDHFHAKGGRKRHKRGYNAKRQMEQNLSRGCAYLASGRESRHSLCPLFIWLQPSFINDFYSVDSGEIHFRLHNAQSMRTFRPAIKRSIKQRASIPRRGNRRSSPTSWSPHLG